MKLRDKRFWILEIMVSLTSLGVGYSMLYEGFDLTYFLIFLLSGLMSALIAHQLNKFFSLFLAVWAMNAILVSICFLAPNLSKASPQTDYLYMFLIMYALISFIPFALAVKLYNLISNRK